MAKIQWPKNPEIGDQIPAPYGGAWVWDGCIWEHTCCPVTICNYEANGGIDMVLKFTGTGGDLAGVTISIYYWISYIGSYGGYPKFFSAIGDGSITVEWDGSQWVFTAVDALTTSFTATAPDLTGPWTVDIPYSEPGQTVLLEFNCGPRYPKCIKITDSVNGYTETKTWIPISYDFPSLGLVWAYAPASSPTSGPTAINGGDLSLFYASFFASTWVLNYEYYYLSPPDPGFQFNIPFGGLNDTEISNGTFTYNSYGANIKFEISDDPNYSCFSG